MAYAVCDDRKAALNTRLNVPAILNATVVTAARFAQ
jgi:hypothetical protein